MQMSESQMSKSHDRASLLHHLLFGPTLSADRRRAGVEPAQACSPSPARSFSDGAAVGARGSESLQETKGQKSDLSGVQR